MRIAALYLLILFTAIGALALITPQAESQETTLPPVLYHTTRVVSASPEKARQSLAWLRARGEKDVAAHLIMSARFSPLPRDEIYDALSSITGHNANSWFDWMLWQQANPGVKPHATLVDFKSLMFATIDPAFLRFVNPQSEFDIRLEEIVWGGVRVDGIPALDNPKFLTASKAKYLKDTDEVFALEINGDARAYPLRIMGWHEMFNDVIGGVPISLAYCTLCGAGIAFEGDHKDAKQHGVDAPFTFGSSGFLYQSNKLMYDRNTDSLWNQFTGEPVSGKLRGSGIQLKIRPVIITTWADWKQQHPDTKVLDIKTGFNRDYGSGVVYNEYFASPELMFPARGDLKDRLTNKDQVFGLRLEGGSKAWPLDAFQGGQVINDRVGVKNVVLIGDTKTRTVRAYERGNLTLDEDLKGWTLTEDALIGKDGTRLKRLPGHVSYWFAWAGYLGDESALFQGAL